MTAATKTISVALLLLASLAATSCLPLSKSKGVLITPDNLRGLASFIAPEVTIGDETVTVAAGSQSELIRVPLAIFGELDPNTVVRITLAQPRVGGRDYDVRIGISDGETNNMFIIGDNGDRPECYTPSRSGTNNVIGGNTLSSQVVMLFEPFHRYGTCSTAQNGGYVNVGRFSNKVDLTNGLDLVVNRDEIHETYAYYYFLVELI